jgi:hypothetical protein
LNFKIKKGKKPMKTKKTYIVWFRVETDHGFRVKAENEEEAEKMAEERNDNGEQPDYEEFARQNWQDTVEVKE